MQQSNFVTVFQKTARQVLSDDSVVHVGKKLYYEIFLDRKLEIGDQFHSQKPGRSAFQTDICICEKRDGIEFPRVVIEFKEDITTHDVLTYSAKAGLHKRLYPCLRYGMLASRLNHVPQRFFIHNEHIDFFVAAKEYQNANQLREMARRLIEAEFRISKTLEEIRFGKHKRDYFCKRVDFCDFDDTTD